MSFLRGERMIAFQENDQTVEIVVPNLYGDQEQKAILALLERFRADHPALELTPLD